MLQLALFIELLLQIWKCVCQKKLQTSSTMKEYLNLRRISKSIFIESKKF